MRIVLTAIVALGMGIIIGLCASPREGDGAGHPTHAAGHTALDQPVARREAAPELEGRGLEIAVRELRKRNLALEREVASLKTDLAEYREDPTMVGPEERVRRWKERTLQSLAYSLPDNHDAVSEAELAGYSNPRFVASALSLPDGDYELYMEANWRVRLSALSKMGVSLDRALATKLYGEFVDSWTGFRRWVQGDYRALVEDVESLDQLRVTSQKYRERLTETHSRLQLRYKMALRDQGMSQQALSAIMDVGL